MIERLFVYGSLAPGRPNERWLTDVAGTWEPASMRGSLHPEGWGATMGYPAVIPAPDGEVIEGLLFASAQLGEKWAALDEFEGFAYERVTVDVRTQAGEVLSAYVYALSRR